MWLFLQFSFFADRFSPIPTQTVNLKRSHMKKILIPILFIPFGLSACGQISVHQQSQITTTNTLDNVIGFFSESHLTASNKLAILKMPPMQPVIVRAGTNISRSASDAEVEAYLWDRDSTQSWKVELPNGKEFILTQKGPQFYQNQMATLIRHGLNVTLIK
jgi:hypothetical protein